MKKGITMKIRKYIWVLFLLVSLTGCMTPLGNAAKSGDINSVRDLIDGGADVNEEIGGLDTSPSATPLHMAANNGRIDIVSLLLEKGANVNARDNWGATPLHWAACSGHANIVRLLLDKGATSGGRSSGYDCVGTPLQIAEKRGHTTIARMLKEAEEGRLSKS